MTTPPHICHVFSGFDPGGAEIRTVQIINRLGANYRHTIVATNGRYGASSQLAEAANVALLPPPPGKGGWLYPLAFRTLLATLRPALLATYNWGAIDATIGAVLGGTCPVVHAEDGFGSDEAERLKRRRVIVRRFLLRRIFATVVPSRTLMKTTLTEYGVPPDRVRLIRNGVDLARFRQDGDRRWRRAVDIPDDAVLVGFVGALRPEKRVDYLLRAVSLLADPSVWVVVVGDGPCRAELENFSVELGLRVRFAGNLNDPACAYPSFDLFAISSLTEQMPIVVLEAMASALPIVATDVGDIADMIGPSPVPVVAGRDDLQAYTDMLRALIAKPALRLELGMRNRRRCEAEFSDIGMISRYHDLYQAAITSGIQ